MEDNIERLRAAICEKRAPLCLAETRLDRRAERPGVELCRDDVQYRLIEEVSEITGSVEQLQARLKQSEDSLKVRDVTSSCHEVGKVEREMTEITAVGATH